MNNRAPNRWKNSGFPSVRPQAPGGKLDQWNSENAFAKVEPCDFIAEVNGESEMEAILGGTILESCPTPSFMGFASFCRFVFRCI